MMNSNRLAILSVLAAALALSGCGGAAEKAGDASVAAAPSAATPSPAKTAGGVANASQTNVSAAPPSPTAAGAPPQAASGASAARSANSAPPAAMPTPEIGSGGNDLFLFTQARAAINADPELKAANLTLEVKEGVVTLSGTVASAAQKSKAEQLVRGAGSRAVKNQLRVSAGS
jgi:hyperosmotically inducible protein